MTTTEQATHTELPPVAQLMQMITAKWITHMVSVAARLGIADLLKDGPRRPEDLAAETNTHARSLYRLLRALASAGIFAEMPDGRFAQTPISDCLRTDARPSLRHMAIMVSEDWHSRSWDQLLYSVQTGLPAVQKVFGMAPFEYLEKHPEAAEVFNKAMTDHSTAESYAVAEAYDFSSRRLLVDVAGGHGHLLATVLARHPGVKGILFDMPQVIAGVEKAGHLASLDGRCRRVSGSFFESVPKGADAYMMKHIIHDWDDEQARQILINCREAAAPGAKLLVVEHVVASGPGPNFVKLLDIEMLVLPGGRERTESEYAELFASAGFKLTRVVPTAAQISVIEGEPA